MNTLFLDACRRKSTPRIPVWYMRQAGRYMPQYRKLKETHTILDIVKTPELAAQVTLLPVDHLGVDAAILFADIMIPLLGSGVKLDIVESIGPVIQEPISKHSDVQKMRPLEPTQDIRYLLDTIAILTRELADRVPLIGFSAAPFTLASYLIEGKPTRDFIKTKTLMYTDRPTWDLLMEKLTVMIITYLHAQVDAGVQVLQLFDSWVGALSESDYREYVLPYTSNIFQDLATTTSVPLIHFGTNTAGLMNAFASVDCDVIGVDWRMSLTHAWKQIGDGKAIQGNLDPVLLLADFSTIQTHVDDIIDSLPTTDGFIFNLGHGVLQATPMDTIQRLTEYVHAKPVRHK